MRGREITTTKTIKVSKISIGSSADWPFATATVSGVLVADAVIYGVQVSAAAVSVC